MQDHSLARDGIHVSSLRVVPEWLDYNGHMNVAYYSLAFDVAGENFVKELGMGEEYTERTRNSWMVVEAHITYQNEARLDEELRISSRALAASPKAAHLYQEMYRGGELLATQEQLVLHVSLETRRSSPFEAEVYANLEAAIAKQAHLAVPEWVGRTIGIRKKG